MKSHTNDALTTRASAVFAQQEYQYNVTVVIASDNNRDMAGKLWLYLEGKNANKEPFDYEIKLTPHTTPLRTGNTYSFYVAAPYPIEMVESVSLWWRQKSWEVTNLFGINRLHVKEIILEPGYVTGSTRAALTHKYCSTTDPVVLESDIKYKFFVPC